MARNGGALATPCWTSAMTTLLRDQRRARHNMLVVFSSLEIISSRYRDACRSRPDDVVGLGAAVHRDETFLHTGRAWQ